MNYKQWVVPMLRELNANRQAIENIPYRIQTIRMRIESIKASKTDGDVVSGGTDKEDVLVSQLLEISQLEKNLEIVKREASLVEQALATLPADERTILEKMYVDGGKKPVDALCEAFGIEVSQIYKKKDVALQAFAKALVGVVNL